MRPVKPLWTDLKTELKARSLWVSWGVLALLVLVLHGYVEYRYVEQRYEDERSLLTDRLSVIRYQLESTLANNLSLINGLAAFIATYPDFSQAQFDLYASTVMSREPSLVNLAVAPDLVVRYVYPVAGNEAALGLDYMQQVDQRDGVLRVIQNGSLVIAGPITLVQGGVAFVGRAPVYVRDAAGNDVLWGIVSSPMLAEAIYERAGLLNGTSGLMLAIRGTDGLASPDAFFGDNAVFSNPVAVTMPVAAGGSSWELGAVPGAGFIVPAGNLLRLRTGSVLVFLLLALLLFLRSRQMRQNRSLRSIIFRNERFLRAVETVSHVGGWRWSGTDFTEMSAQTRSIMQLPDDEQSVDMVAFCHSLDQDSRDSVSHYIRSAWRNRHRLDQELELRRRDGAVIWLHLKADVVAVDDDAPELIGALQDVTQQKQVDQLIEYQANYDQLTALPNRALFLDRLQNALRQSRRRSARLAVLFIDLDNFKSVNDNLGHDAGDELLIESARRIQSCVRADDTLARHSGDEFVALIGDVFSANVASRIAEKMILCMREPFMIGERQVYCGASVGVSFYPDDGDSADTLVIKADQAMYEVKKSGRNAWQFYTAAMQAESERKHQLYNELVAAVNDDQLIVHYQPVVSAETGCIVGCEALVRWPREYGPWIPPDEFIQVAEERGLINRIDLLVLQRSLQFISELNEELGTAVTLSVNVSPRLLHMRDDDARDWLEILNTQDRVAVTIEITERVLVDESANIRKILQELNLAGVRIAIDDFGTGYSGLSYFSRFPVSAVKIDRSFVRDLGIGATETTLVETILLLGSKLGIEVIAEGVETGEQAAFLRTNRCDLLQGYHIAPPLPGADFYEFVRRSKTSAAEIH